MKLKHILMYNVHDRLKTLDGLRGIAALAVMIFHFTLRRFSFGHYGVQLFFIISGFVIFLTILKIDSVKLFTLKRIFRLFPAFIVCMTISTICINMFPQYTSDHIDTKRYLLNLTMIPEVIGSMPVDTSYWSLIPEIFFYVLMAFTLLIKQQKNMIAICYIWAALIVINCIFKIESFFPAIKIFNIRHGQLFIAGIVFYLLYNGKKGYSLYILLIISFLISLFIYPFYYPELYPLKSHIVIISLIYSIFFLFIYNKLSFFEHLRFEYIGKISYSLYLLHQTVGLILLNYLSATTSLNKNIIFIFTSFIIIISASAIYYLVELPAVRLGNKLTKKIK